MLCDASERQVNLLQFLSFFNYKLITINYNLSSYPFAIVIPITSLAPACLSRRAHSSRVEPEVATSSKRRTLLFFKLESGRQRKTPLIFPARWAGSLRSTWCLRAWARNRLLLLTG